MSSKPAIYADYQASTPVDPTVVDAMAPYWNQNFGNPHASSHYAGWRTAKVVEEAAATIANLVGADPDEVFFTSGATESNNLALLGLTQGGGNSNRNRILIGATEHACVHAISEVLHSQHGFNTSLIPVNSEGFINNDALDNLLGDDVLLVSVMAVNNEIGTIQNVEAIAGKIASHGAIFHCDAAQSPCAIDMGNLSEHAQIISLSAHKMYGPQGIGAIIIHRDLQEHFVPIIHGGEQQLGIRSGTVPVALCAGMAAACKIISSPTYSKERLRVAEQRNRFVNALTSNGTFKISSNGSPTSSRHPGNANLQFHGFNGQDLLDKMQPHIAASTGAACSTGTTEPSRTLMSTGLSKEQAEASIRFSYGRFTTDEDISRSIELVLQTLESAVAAVA